MILLHKVYNIMRNKITYKITTYVGPGLIRESYFKSEEEARTFAEKAKKEGVLYGIESICEDNTPKFRDGMA